MMNLETFRAQFFAGAPRYQWIETLGRGGTGVVYKALDRELGDVVAIKVLLADFGEDDGATVARFKREINLNRRINHPNVARMYEFGTSAGRPYITMEFIPGKELSALVAEETRLPPARAIPILRQILEGTAAAHVQGIVHRDLKSANVLVGEGDLVSILDFGLARMQSSERLTIDAVVLGTPHYISPEQALGKPADARSDIYSIGVIAFETLSGSLPFPADSVLAIAMKHVTDPIPGNLALCRDVSLRLRGAVHKALAKNPDDRFQSAEAFDEELGRVEEELRRGAGQEAVPTLEVQRPHGAPAAAAGPSPVDTTTPVVRHRPRPKRPVISEPLPAPGPARAHAGPAWGVPPQPPLPPSRQPYQPFQPFQPPPPPPPPPQPQPPGRKPAVFVVNGDGAVRIPAAAALAASGCTAVEAKTGEEALQLLVDHPADAVVIDVALPGMDGFEVSRILRRQPALRELPIVLLAHQPDRRQTALANQVGATDLLPRPLSDRDLVGRVWRYLTARGFSRDEARAPVRR